MDSITSASTLCQHFGVCGGCEFQNIIYDEQLRNKQKYIENLFKEFEIKEIKKIIPSPQIWFYRNKMEFAVGGEISFPVIGLRQRNKFQKIVDLTECKIFFGNINQIFKIIKDWIKETKLQPYNLITHQGKIRYITFRHSKKFNELMLNIVITGTKYQFENTEKQFFVSLVKELKKIVVIKSVYVGINNKMSDNALTEEMFLLDGSEYIKEVINGITYKIFPRTFLQTNSFCCELLYNEISSNISDGNVLDIYCGSGGISLQIARKTEPHFVEKVIGIDSLKENIDIAENNAIENKIYNTEFVYDNAELFLSKIWKSKFITNLSTIIVDPPRAGLSKKVKSIIMNSGINKIVYVSCNPESLKEDLKTVVKFYRIKKLVPIDMFPHTRHLEVVAVMEHR